MFQTRRRKTITKHIKLTNKHTKNNDKHDYSGKMFRYEYKSQCLWRR